MNNKEMVIHFLRSAVELCTAGEFAKSLEAISAAQDYSILALADKEITKETFLRIFFLSRDMECDIIESKER